MTVRGVVDVALETDARFLERGPPRVDAPFLATVTSVLDEISVEVSRERIADSPPNDTVEGFARTLARGFKRHENHLRGRG